MTNTERHAVLRTLQTANFRRSPGLRRRLLLSLLRSLL